MNAGHIHAEALRLPFQGTETLSRHTSYLGAKHAEERAGRQALALLALYRQHGALTDAEACRLLGVERTTVNARRNELIRLCLVRALGMRKNTASGVMNTAWGLV